MWGSICHHVEREASRLHHIFAPDTAEWLEALVSPTLALMNAGATLDDVLRSVKPPAHLAERRYLQPVYDEPDYVVRNLWRLYGGWYDGVPSHLKPAPEAELGREILTLAGGIDDLIARPRGSPPRAAWR